MGNLHTRIAGALGWTTEQARQHSLQSLRELVRPIDADLANEIAETIRSGRYVASKPRPIKLATPNEDAARVVAILHE